MTSTLTWNVIHLARRGLRLYTGSVVIIGLFLHNVLTQVGLPEFMKKRLTFTQFRVVRQNSDIFNKIRNAF